MVKMLWNEDINGKFFCKSAFSYRPELDVSPHLEQDDHTWYQQLLGILNWIVELGRIDVHNIVATFRLFGSSLGWSHQGRPPCFCIVESHKQQTYRIGQNIANTSR